MTKQTEAQRLADWLELDPSEWGGVHKVAWPAAAELRRLESELEALRGAVPAGSLALNAALGYIERNTPHLVYSAIKAALAAPQPAAQPTEPAGEPVAWMDAQALEELRKPEMNWMPAWNRQNGKHPIAIYTRPAVPLTDEKIHDIARNKCHLEYDDGSDVEMFARAIEAAHKIGGAE